MSMKAKILELLREKKDRVAAGGSNDYAYNEDRSSDYRHLNHILSAYAGYTLRYKDFTFKPGLRCV